MKVTELFCWVIVGSVALYLLLVLFVIGVCWVTGLPPAHPLPGMASYESWGVK